MMTRTDRALIGALLCALSGWAGGCQDPDSEAAFACGGVETSHGGAPACLSTADPLVDCPPSAPVASTWGRLRLCAAVSLDEATFRRMLASDVCRPDAVAVMTDDVVACLTPADKADSHCPALLPYGTEVDDVAVCATHDGLQADELEALVSSGCEGGAAVFTEAGTSCVFITETGFSCPPFLLGSSQVGDWTVCGEADATSAEAAAAASCGDGGHLATSGASGCVFITETGFHCPPHLTRQIAIGDAGVCGGPSLTPLGALAIGSAHCGPGSQMVAAADRSLCAVFITETGFTPCPATHPVRRVAKPFDMCATTALSPSTIAQGRLEICGSSTSGAYVDIGAHPLCAYAITETGFDCPPLLPTPYGAGAATVCGRSPGLAQSTVDLAGQFAAAPSLCPWTTGFSNAFAHSLGGLLPTVSGAVMSGSYTQYDGFVFPGGVTVDASKASGHFVADVNLNGSIADVDLVATTDIHDLNACGHAMLSDGSAVLAGVGHGLVDFAAAGSGDLGDGGLYIIRLDPYGAVQSATTAPLNAPWGQLSCDVGVSEERGVRVILPQSFAATPTGFVYAFDASNELLSNSAVAHHLDGVVGHASGFTVVGAYTDDLELPAAGGGSITLAGQTGQTGDAESVGFVARLNEAGEALWARTISSAGARVWAVGLAPDDGVVITGSVAADAAVVDPVTGATLATAVDPVPDTSMDDTFVARLDGSGAVIWVTRAAGQGNNGGQEISVGLDGNVHLGGRYVGILSYGEGDDALTISNASIPTAAFYSGYVARFGLADGAPLSLVPTSTDEPNVVESSGDVVGHLDGSTTHAGMFMAKALFGVPGAEVELDKGPINAGIFIVYSGVPGSECTTITP